jgi:ribosomal-protein-alanine N-acetyltransferase
MADALTLRTARLSLVPAAVAHVPLLFPLMSDPRVTTFLAWEPHASESETLEVVEALVSAQSRAMGYHWTIFEGERVRGLVSLIDVQRKHRSWTLERAEVAYWVDPESQGKGIATEATAAVVACAFERLGLNRLRISHTGANPASGRIPQKLGFTFVGTERQFFKKNDVWHDMNHYELLAQDWLPAQ